MKPAPFAYHRPATLEEAVQTLAAVRDTGKVLAGGQSLVPLMSMRLASPEHVVDINHLPGLADVRVAGGEVYVGALARHSDVEQHEAAYDTVPLLRQALRHVAHPTIRNRGTTVGSLVHADPAGEMPAVLLLLDGRVRLRSTAGEREVPAGEFFLGPMESAVRPDELAIGAAFRMPATGSGTAFTELARRHGDYAMCGAGAVVTTDPDGAVTRARVGLVSAGPTAVLVDATAAVTGSGGGFAPARVHELVTEAISPEDDIHATAEYRAHLARTLALQVLEEARGRAVGRHSGERVA
ncbi:MAG TPA: xanthine dehydrogenase family protein subunit M [Nocardioidaceae bacterium]|nr:xanthine dehydrogenase family protein subunit M [Nocardioidaceae bacterium]